MRRTTSAICLILACAACTDGGNWRAGGSFPFSPETGPPAVFAEVFEVVDSIVLEEKPAEDVVTTAAPMIRFDGQVFLMADYAAQQARVYATDGRLLDFRGRAGQGPGEFVFPVSARRTQDGRLLVADAAQNRLTTFLPDPAAEPATMMLPVAPLDAIELDAQRYLVTGFRPSGLHPDSTQAMLHVWNTESQTIDRSFFEPPRPDYLGVVASSGETVFANVHGEAIWVVSAFTDSAFVFDMDGTQTGSLPLPLAKQPPPDALERWETDRFFFLSTGHVVVDGGIRVEGKRDLERQYLMIVDREGNARATLANTPILRAVANDLFYFQNPGRMEPNHWIVARWRAS